MTKMEKWANTMELLHEIEPPPFNPDYNEEYAYKCKMQDAFMYNLRQELHKLEDNENEDILDKIEDMVYIYVSALNNNHGYTITNGTINHNTERGQNS